MEERQREPEKQELPKFDFMREQIKERPINKRKLLRRTAMTASMAVLFGMVACLTVLVLEPVFNNWLYPEKAAENINFPPETQEMLPEDMALVDEELEESEPEEEAPEETEAAPERIDEMELYRKTYGRLQKLAADVSRSLVTVTGVTSDKDWFDNTYENKGQTAGVIIANNGREYLVLASAEPVKAVEAINVTFCDNSQAQAQIKMTDTITGLAVLAIDNKEIADTTREQIATAKLGGSNYASLTGSPVIAMGSPGGISGSMIYGVATSSGNELNTVDSRYKLITTDIYGSRAGTGVLINLQGEIIGVIDQKYNAPDMENMISAVGISELRMTIERLSNGKSQAYMGIYGTDVTEEANEKLQVPFGAYVTGIELDSPAMQAGIQSGDVIVSLNGRTVGNYDEYIRALQDSTPGSTVNVTLMRKNQEEYKAMSFLAPLGELD